MRHSLTEKVPVSRANMNAGNSLPDSERYYMERCMEMWDKGKNTKPQRHTAFWIMWSLSAAASCLSS